MPQEVCPECLGLRTIQKNGSDYRCRTCNDVTESQPGTCLTSEDLTAIETLAYVCSQHSLIWNIRRVENVQFHVEIYNRGKTERDYLLIQKRSGQLAPAIDAALGELNQRLANCKS